MNLKDLPANNPFPPASDERRAYGHAYDLAFSSGRRTEPRALSGRVLGFMLVELPWDEGRSKMASEINSCTNDEKLIELGQFYVHHFFRCCEHDLALPAINVVIFTGFYPKSAPQKALLPCHLNILLAPRLTLSVI
jgi:hypothetical protein